jgi:Meiotically up-regulated gene 113
MGQIYFFVDYDNKKVKIGHSKNPKQRLKQIKTGYPGKLVIAKTVPGTPHDERKYHRLFCHDRIIREWFHLSSTMEYFLSR